MNIALNQNKAIDKNRDYKKPLFIVLLFCFATAILGDSTAEALLLAHTDAHVIPSMFLVNAVFLFVLSAFLMSFIDRVDRGKLFLGLTLCHGFVLLLIRILVGMHFDFLYLPLFSYAYVTKILLFLLFWTLANDLVDSRKASTVFPFVASGGTIGAVCISFLLPSLLHLIRAENLLVVWAVLSIVVGCFFIPFRAQCEASFKPSPDKRVSAPRTFTSIVSDMKIVQSEPLLKNMAIFYFFLFFILLNQHFVFYSQLKKYLFDARELGSFLGYFNGTSMVATFLLQIGVAGIVLKKIGSTRSMMFLPVALCIVFGAQIVISFGTVNNSSIHSAASLWMFWSIVFGMGIRIAFFDSFFSPNFQVFFSGLPKDIRGRGKLSIEGVIKPAAIIVASIWMLFVVPHIPFPVTVCLLFCVSVGLLVQTFRIRNTYTQSLSSYLTHFSTKKLPALFKSVPMSSSQNIVVMLGDILDKETTEIKKFIIAILADINTKESTDVLTSRLAICDAVTRGTIISSLSRFPGSDLNAIYVKYIHDNDTRVCANSIMALAHCSNEETKQLVKPFLYHSNNRVRANAAIVLWDELLTNSVNRLVSDVLVTMIETGTPLEKSSALFAMGTIGAQLFFPHILKFAQKHGIAKSKSTPMRRQLLYALGNYPTKESFDCIISLSGSCTVRGKTELVNALSLMMDKGYPRSMCMQQLPYVGYDKRGIVLRSLLVNSVPLKKNEVAMLEQVAKTELESIYADWLNVSILDAYPKKPEFCLLRSMIYEMCIVEKIKNVGYIAALFDTTGSSKKVLSRLYHANKHVRARAFEVLDNTGNKVVNRSLLSLLDSTNSQKHAHDAIIQYKLLSKTPVQVISQYSVSENEFLQNCAAYAQVAL